MVLAGTGDQNVRMEGQNKRICDRFNKRSCPERWSHFSGVSLSDVSKLCDTSHLKRHYSMLARA